LAHTGTGAWDVYAAAAGVAGATATVAGAVTLFALPALVSLAALSVWGIEKHEHHEVNKEIWNWWYARCAATWELDPEITLDFLTAKRWLGWFGDEGISNMNHLHAKLKEAKKAFDDRCNAVVQSRNELARKIPEALRIRDPQQKIAAIQRLDHEADGLANKYMELGKDLTYIVYRLQRNLMYHQMLELTVRSLIVHMHGSVPQASQFACKDAQSHYECYRRLLESIVGFCQPPQVPAVARAASMPPAPSVPAVTRAASVPPKLPVLPGRKV